jgi:large subunit ribosomal protein L6
MQKKNLIKIPKNILVIFNYEKKIITLIGPLLIKSLKLGLNIIIKTGSNIIEVTDKPFQKSYLNKKQIKSLQGTTVALIKQSLIETSALIYNKLKIIGVGYRFLNVEGFNNELLMFKLGYSHSLYYKIPNDLKIFNLKSTKLFIYGNSYQNVSQTGSIIRSYKKPEPYKGKGILFDSEKILLKEGKKV